MFIIPEKHFKKFVLSKVAAPKLTAFLEIDLLTGVLQVFLYSFTVTTSLGLKHALLFPLLGSWVMSRVHLKLDTTWL